MRNLFNLIARNHRLVLFLILEVIALRWMSATHGTHRGSISQSGIKYASSWTDFLGRISTFSEIRESNKALLRENSRLRTRNHNLAQALKYSEIQYSLDELSSTSWYALPSEVIRSTTHLKDNLIVVDKGIKDGVKDGSGMLFNGKLAGKVIEATESESLVFPIINRKTEWSVRIGSSGPVGRMIWSGENISEASVIDIPKSALVLPGDLIQTTGFGGVFPADIEVGVVKEVHVTEADEFQTLTIDLGADYSSIRYVELIRNGGFSLADSLISNQE